MKLGITGTDREGIRQATVAHHRRVGRWLAIAGRRGEVRSATRSSNKTRLLTTTESGTGRRHQHGVRGGDNVAAHRDDHRHVRHVLPSPTRASSEAIETTGPPSLPLDGVASVDAPTAGAPLPRVRDRSTALLTATLSPSTPGRARGGRSTTPGRGLQHRRASPSIPYGETSRQRRRSTSSDPRASCGAS